MNLSKTCNKKENQKPSLKHNYVKLLAIRSGELLVSEILEEVHRDNNVDAAKYILEHPHDQNTMWILLPQ